MFPAATNQVLPAESSWASTAFSNLSEGLGDVYDPGLGSQRVAQTTTENPSLSESIAEQVEDELEQESHLQAQDSREIEQEDAQERRTEKNRVDVSDASSGPISAESGKLSREASSSVRPYLGPAGRIHGQAMTARQAASPEVVSSETLQRVDARPTHAAQLLSPPAMRGVPAAVLRAIEVEANIEAGARNASVLRSGQNARSHAPTAIKSMAEAEIRTLQGMTTLMAQRGGRMRVQLNPLQLGSVTIDVKVDGNRVEASIEAATKAAVKVLEASTSRLRLSLESQGYNLDRIEIKHETQSSTTSEDSRSENDSKDSRSDEPDSDGKNHRNRTSGRQQASNASNEEFSLIPQTAQEIDG